MKLITCFTHKLTELVLLFLCGFLLAACGSDSSSIRGIWTAPSGSSIEITADKWIAHAGPMQINLTYMIKSSENGKIVVTLDSGSGENSGHATLSVSGDVLTITNNSLYEGAWTRKK